MALLSKPTGRRLSLETIALGGAAVIIVIVASIHNGPPAATTRATATTLQSVSQNDWIRNESLPRESVVTREQSKNATSDPAESYAEPVALSHSDLNPISLAKGSIPAETQIESIASRSDLPDRLKARLLIEVLPALPEDIRAKAAEEAANRLPDSDYAAVLLPIVVDPGTHGTVMSVLFADLMERPDTIALPTLLATARDPRHPFAPSARDNLSLLLGQDFESWAKCEMEIQRRMSLQNRP